MIKKIICFILILLIVFSICIPAFAVTSTSSDFSKTFLSFNSDYVLSDGLSSSARDGLIKFTKLVSDYAGNRDFFVVRRLQSDGLFYLYGFIYPVGADASAGLYSWHTTDYGYSWESWKKTSSMFFASSASTSDSLIQTPVSGGETIRLVSTSESTWDQFLTNLASGDGRYKNPSIYNGVSISFNTNDVNASNNKLVYSTRDAHNHLSSFSHSGFGTSSPVYYIADVPVSFNFPKLFSFIDTTFYEIQNPNEPSKYFYDNLKNGIIVNLDSLTAQACFDYGITCMKLSNFPSEFARISADILGNSSPSCGYDYFFVTVDAFNSGGAWCIYFIDDVSKVSLTSSGSPSDNGQYVKIEGNHFVVKCDIDGTLRYCGGFTDGSYSLSTLRLGTLGQADALVFSNFTPKGAISVIDSNPIDTTNHTGGWGNVDSSIGGVYKAPPVASDFLSKMKEMFSLYCPAAYLAYPYYFIYKTDDDYRILFLPDADLTVSVSDNLYTFSTSKKMVKGVMTPLRPFTLNKNLSGSLDSFTFDLSCESESDLRDLVFYSNFDVVLPSGSILPSNMIVGWSDFLYEKVPNFTGKVPAPSTGFIGGASGIDFSGILNSSFDIGAAVGSLATVFSAVYCILPAELVSVLTFSLSALVIIAVIKFAF